MEKMLQIFQFVGAVLRTASAAFIIYDRLVPDQDHGCHRAQVARDAQDLQPRRRSIRRSRRRGTALNDAYGHAVPRADAAVRWWAAVSGQVRQRLAMRPKNSFR